MNEIIMGLYKEFLDILYNKLKSEKDSKFRIEIYNNSHYKMRIELYMELVRELNKELNTELNNELDIELYIT